MDISQLEAAAGLWEKLGYWATAIVALGVAGESVHLYRPKLLKSEETKLRLERISVAILMFGLAFEMLTQGQANGYNARIVAELQLQANEAAKAAKTAAKDAETERLERVKLEERIAPRRLTRTQQEEIAVDLAPLQGRVVMVKSYALDLEGGVLGKQLIGCFDHAQITVIDRSASESGIGGFALGIYVYGPDTELVNAIAQSIATRTGLTVQHGSNQPVTGASLSMTGPGDNIARATVLVGAKPPVP